MPTMLKKIRDQQDLILFGFAICFGFVLILNSAFRVSFDLALLLAAPLGFGAAVGFNWVLKARHRKQDTPLRIERHPELGKVRIFHNRWEAKFSGPPFTTGIELSGDPEAGSTSDVQTALFRQICERHHSILAAALASLSKDLNMVKPPINPQDLQLRSIWLGADCFSYYFDVPSRSTAAPDGFYADFSNFQLEEAGWVH